MNIALIVAAGNGTRMGEVEKPKQFLLVNDKPLLIYSLETFNNHQLIDAIIVVTSKEYIGLVKDLVKQYQLSKVVDVVLGGSTRQESVHNGLMKAKEVAANIDNDIVLIHDAARPLVSQEIISNNILECEKYDAVTTVINASDTIVHSKNSDTVNDVPLRKELYQSQTPQSFKLSLILSAHDSAKVKKLDDVTDDAQLVLLLNKEVHLVKGDKRNFKITTFDDLLMLKALL